MSHISKVYPISSETDDSYPYYLQIMTEAFYSEYMQIWYGHGVPVDIDWKQHRIHTIASVDLCVVFVSSYFSKSLVAQYEMLVALDLKKPIVCVLTQTMSLPDLLLDKPVLDIPAFDGDDWTKHILDYLPGPQTRASHSPFIFIAYSHKQHFLANQLYRMLIDNGFLVFFDRVMKPGESWRQQIQIALDQSDCVVVIWTSDAAKSEEVNLEVEYAISERKKVIPLVSRDGSKLPYYMQSLHYIPFDDSLSQIENELIKALGHFSRKEEFSQ